MAVVKPACGEASHCIGVRALSRLTARMRVEHGGRVAARGDALGVVVERLDVPEVVDPRERRVRHAELLALVDVRRPAVQVQHGAEQLGRAHAVRAVVAEARHDPRLVVVVPVEAVPAALGQAALPAPERALEVGQPQRVDLPLARAVVDVDVLELEDHVDLAVRGVGVALGVLERHAGHLADGQQPVTAGEHLAMHLLQELVDPRQCRTRPVLQAGVLGDEVDDVHAEAVDPAVQPPAHHRVDRLADLRVLPVEVGLLAREQVQVVLARRGVGLPAGPGEERAPVVRRLGAGATSTSRASRCRGSRGTPRTTGARRTCGLPRGPSRASCRARAPPASSASKSASVPNTGSTSW